MNRYRIMPAGVVDHRADLPSSWSSVLRTAYLAAHPGGDYDSWVVTNHISAAKLLAWRRANIDQQDIGAAAYVAAVDATGDAPAAPDMVITPEEAAGGSGSQPSTDAVAAVDASNQQAGVASDVAAARQSLGTDGTILTPQVLQTASQVLGQGIDTITAGVESSNETARAQLAADTERRIAELQAQTAAQTNVQARAATAQQLAAMQTLLLQLQTTRSSGQMKIIYVGLAALALLVVVVAVVSRPHSGAATQNPRRRHHRRRTSRRRRR